MVRRSAAPSRRRPEGRSGAHRAGTGRYSGARLMLWTHPGETLMYAGISLAIGRAARER
jgi:hypothetical protein